MPLIVNPTSTCDVCLDIYAWDAPSDTSKPHAIACGHVFCLGCLQRMRPSTCPLCRKAFLPDRAKKLHIDKPFEHDDSARVNEYLQRLGSASSDNDPEGVAQCLNEVRQWLDTRDDGNHIVYRPLRLAILALQRYSNQTERFRRYLHIKEQDLQTSRTIEMNLVERISRLEDEYTNKLARAEKAVSETEYELSLLRAEHAHFRAELARYQARENPSRRQHSYSADDVPPQVQPRSQLVWDATIGRMFRETQRVPSPEPVVQRRITATIIPGAPPSKKVIPPLPPSPLPNMYAYGNVIQTRPSAAASFAQGASSRSERTPRSTSVAMRTPGYEMNAGGYVPLENPALAAVSQAEERAAVSQLGLFSEPLLDGYASAGRTVEAAARDLAATNDEVESYAAAVEDISTAFGRALMLNDLTSLAVPTPAVVTNHMDGASVSSHAVSANASLNDLGILAAPSASQAPVVGSIRSIPQDVTSEAPSPEPSAASTWGTLSTTRTPRSLSMSILEVAGLPPAEMLVTEPPSRNSSLVDLNGIAGLPSTLNLAAEPPSRGSGIAEHELASQPRMRSSLSVNASTQDHAGPVGVTETPRPFPWFADPSDQMGRPGSQEARSSWLLQGEDVSSAAANFIRQMTATSQQQAGLGLVMVPPSENGSQVAGHDDLAQVNASLQQLLDEERARASRRRSRYSSISALEHQMQSSVSTLDLQGVIGISDSLFAPPSDAQMASGTASNLSRSQYEDSSEEQRFPVAVASDLDHGRRRHSSAFLVESPTAVAHSQDGPMSARREPDSRVSLNREPQVSLSDPSADLAGHASSHDPSSPPEIAASQSRNSLVDGTSLLLSFAPSSTSSAVASGSQPTTIHAPRPIDRRHSGNFFGFFHPRNRR